MASAESPDFNQDVRPILSNHCFACHGPDEEHRIADVRLDVADEVDLNDVLNRIMSDDPDYVMPPPELNKPLSESQVAKLTAWVEDGAAYQRHWSFVPPSIDAAVDVNPSTWSDQPIDRFVEKGVGKSWTVAFGSRRQANAHPSPIAGPDGLAADNRRSSPVP